MKELATLLQDTRENKEGLDGGSPGKQAAAAASQQAVFHNNAGATDSVCLISSPAERMLRMLDQLLNNEQVGRMGGVRR